MIKIKNQNGFTMIELLVSLSIIVILTGIFLANYHSSDKNNKLILSAKTLVSNIRLAENLSIGTSWYGNDPPAGGFGIYFSMTNTGAYRIFGDVNDNMRYDSGENYVNTIFSLPKNVVIDSLIAGGASRTRLDITFYPPEPTVRISSGSVNYSEATIRLRQTEDNIIKNVNINSFGMVEITD